MLFQIKKKTIPLNAQFSFSSSAPHREILSSMIEKKEHNSQNVYISLKV